MSSSLPWYKRDVDAWRGGTRSMPLELRGFYSELLDAMWDTQGPITANIEKLSRMICCNPRTVRKLLPQLVALGKIIETPDGLINARMSKDISEANSAPIRRQFDRNSSRIRPEFEPKNPKNPINSTRDLEVDKDKEKELEEDSHSPTEQVAVRVCESDSDFKLVLEEALQTMVADAQTWIGNGATRAGARSWLSGLVATYGTAAVAKAYHHTVKGVQQGAVRSPENYWPATAERFARGVNVPPPVKAKLTAREALAQLEAENA